MADNQLLDPGFMANEFNIVFGNSGNQKMSPDYFLANFRSLMKRYISNGKPSDDTKNSYYSAIEQFLSWCAALKVDVFKVNEQQLLYYRQVLINKDYKATSIKFKLTAIRRFYYVASKYELIEKNPAADVHAQRDPDAYMPVLKYLTVDQLSKVLQSLSEDEEVSLRTKTIIFLMAVEGLRTIEIHRMNVQDIYEEQKAIYIHGKGHNRAMFAVLFGSYSIDLTVAGTSSFLLLKSMILYFLLFPPPRCLTVILPWLLRPAFFFRDTTRDFSGVLVVISEKSEPVMCLLEGVYGL